MTITEKTKTNIAIALFTVFLASLVYNLSRDPRKIYEPSESPRKELLEQQHKRKTGAGRIREESLLKIDLLDTSVVRYSSDSGRNIFSLQAPPEPVVKPKTAPAKETVSAPVIQEPVIVEKPFLFVGFAQSDEKNLAVLLEKNTQKMIIVYSGMDLGNGMVVKKVERKKVTLFDSNTNQEIEILITE